MKVLIVRNSPTIVNVDNYNVQEIGLAKALIKKGNEVGIILYTDDSFKKEKKDDITIYFLPAKKILNYSIYDNKIYEIISEYDVIQTSEYNQIMSYLFCKKYPNKTIIYHGPYGKKGIISKANNLIFDLFFLRKYKKMNPKIISKSDLAKIFLKAKGFTNIETAGVGLDDTNLIKNDINTDFTNCLDKKNFNMLCIGRVEYLKNTMFILEVLNELVSSNKKYCLFLIGKSNKKYKEKCIKYINDNNLNNNVFFIDNVKQTELKNIYSNCDLFVFPTLCDIFGMVLLESIYFKLPIISSLNGGSSVLLNDYQTIENFNVDEWVDKIKSNDSKLIKYRKSNNLWIDIVDNFINSYKFVGGNNEKNDLISVIVPIYNVGKYLRKCLDSIVNQTYKNLEIILIDDGSTDNSNQICEEYQNMDNRIKVLCKKNGGQSSARNMGLDAMNGEYVCFIDSDDFVHTEMIERLYDILIEKDGEIISCQGMDYYDFEFKQIEESSKRKIEIYNSKEAMLKSNDTLLIRVYQKLFSKKIFNELRFKENVIYEDAQIAPYIYIQTDKTIVISDALYYRFIRNNSTIHSKITEKDFTIIEIAEDRLNFYLKNQYKFLYNQGYTFLLGCYVVLYKKAKKYGAELFQIKKIRTDYKKCYKKNMKNITFLQKIKYGVFVIFPNICIFLLDRGVK